MRCWQIAMILVMALAVAARGDSAAATTKPADRRELTFQVYSGYFVSNKFEPEKEQSFVVVKNQASFDADFNPARVMADPSKRLAADVFTRQLVVATVKRGKATWKFEIKAVTLDGNVLTVHYSAASENVASGNFASPMILSVPKGDYTAIVFEEGGRLAGKVELDNSGGAGGGAATKKN